MKCQVCHTTDKKKFGTSVLICDACLLQKNQANIKAYLQKEIDGMLVGVYLGTAEPKGLLSVQPPAKCKRCGAVVEYAANVAISKGWLCAKCLLADQIVPGGSYEPLIVNPAL